MTQQPNRGGTPLGAPPPAGGPYAPAHYHRFYDTSPTEREDGARTWYARGQVMVIAYSEASPGAALERAVQDDEYGVLLPDPQTTAIIEVAGESATIDGFSLTFVPPGASAVRLPVGGRVVRLFTASADLVQPLPGRLGGQPAHPAATALAGAKWRRTNPLVLARDRARRGLLRPDLPRQHIHGQLHRAVAGAA